MLAVAGSSFGLGQVSFSSKIRATGSAGTNPFICCSSPQAAAPAGAFSGVEDIVGTPPSTPSLKVARKKATTTPGKRVVKRAAAPPKPAPGFATPVTKKPPKKAVTTAKKAVTMAKKPVAAMTPRQKAVAGANDDDEDEEEPTHKFVAGKFKDYQFLKTIEADGKVSGIMLKNARGTTLSGGRSFRVNDIDLDEIEELSVRDMLEFASTIPEDDEDPIWVKAELAKWICPDKDCKFANQGDESSCLNIIAGTVCGMRRALPPGGALGWGGLLTIPQVSVIVILHKTRGILCCNGFLISHTYYLNSPIPTLWNRSGAAKFARKKTTWSGMLALFAMRPGPTPMERKKMAESCVV